MGVIQGKGKKYEEKKGKEEKKEIIEVKAQPTASYGIKPEVSQ